MPLCGVFFSVCGRGVRIRTAYSVILLLHRALLFYFSFFKCKVLLLAQVCLELKIFLLQTPNAGIRGECPSPSPSSISSLCRLNSIRSACRSQFSACLVQNMTCVELRNDVMHREQWGSSALCFFGRLYSELAPG